MESTVQLAGIGLPHGAAHRIQPLRDGAGLECKIKKGGRALCTLYPAAGSFTCLVCIGQREAMAAEALLPLCSPPVRQLYHTASPLNGSRWLMIPVTDEAVLTDVKELIGIRAAA